MSWPDPKPGLVIRYSYLWRREAEQGQEGVKDRPCAIVLAIVDDVDRQHVHVLPVTHTLPQDPTTAVELPHDTKRRLGLDSDRSWIVVSESNAFTWPGPDLRPRINGDPSTIVYGMLPPNLFRIVRDRFLAFDSKQRSAKVKRTE